MRGLSAGSQPSQGSGSTGLWPNVAIYLDNQSGQLPNRNLDIYAADLNRIEVLEGPQGTLFGAGAEAGVIRYITNEPKLDVTEANVKAGYGTTAHGDPNSDVTAVLNVPLIAEHHGGARRDLQRPPRRLHRQRAGDLHPQEHRHRHPLRATIRRVQRRMSRTGSRTTAYACRRGARRSTTPASPATTSTPSPTRASGSRHCTSSTTTGTRSSRSPTRTWTPRACSTSSPMPPTARRCSRSKSRCSTRPTTRTSSRAPRGRVNGKFGDLKAVYTGGYLVRNVEQVGDYTNYSRGVYADYYQCYGPGRGYANLCRPRASRRAPTGARPSATRTSSTNSA